MVIGSVVNVIDTSIQRHPARPVFEEVPVGVSTQQLGAGQSGSDSSGEIGLRRLLGGGWRGSRAKAMAISSQYSRQQRKERRKVGICVESKSGCERESMVAANAKGSEGSWDNVSRPGDYLRR